MKRSSAIFLIVFLLGIDSCKKEETSVSDQFPEWLQAKITELTSEFNLCEYTNVEIIEYKGELYYNISCGAWNCIYCQIFDQNGNRRTWTTGEMPDFLTNKKLIKTVPACQ
jgi:hypothetical protein